MKTLSPRITTSVAEALEELRQRGPVAIPTETVYGLASRIDDPKCLKRVFEMKKRPSFDPLIVHIAHQNQVAALVNEWPSYYEALAKAFWPGPLTLLAPRSSKVDPLITAGLPLVGLRMPKHPVTLELLRKLEIPVAAPSANQFGKTSPTRAEHVLTEFPEDALLILDGGPAEVGLESTVLEQNADGIRILRPGAIGPREIQTVLPGVKIEVRTTHVSPGHLEHHYQPSIPLILARKKDEFKARYRVQQTMQIESSQIVILELPTEATLAARELYEKLRTLSESGAKAIIAFVESVYDSEEWLALKDRLSKAASFNWISS